MSILCETLQWIYMTTTILLYAWHMNECSCSSASSTRRTKRTLLIAIIPQHIHPSLLFTITTPVLFILHTFSLWINFMIFTVRYALLYTTTTYHEKHHVFCFSPFSWFIQFQFQFQIMVIVFFVTLKKSSSCFGFNGFLWLHVDWN